MFATHYLFSMLIRVLFFGALKDVTGCTEQAIELAAGADMGDPNLESDSDFGGTGERAAAGRDLRVRDGNDIDTDHIESIPNLPLTDEDVDFLGSQPPRGPAPGK